MFQDKKMGDRWVGEQAVLLKKKEIKRKKYLISEQSKTKFDIRHKINE